jgi:hypothetical protein
MTKLNKARHGARKRNTRTSNIIFQHPVALVFNYKPIRLPSQVQLLYSYLYVYIDLIL